MVLRLLILQPKDKQSAIVFNTSYNRSLLPDANAIARFIACLRIVFTDLNRLRSGYSSLSIVSSAGLSLPLAWHTIHKEYEMASHYAIHL